MKKNSIFAAILNFLLPGVGYLYAGKKRGILSVGLLVFWIGSIFERVSFRGQWEMALPATILSIVLAIDAFYDARENDIKS